LTVPEAAAYVRLNVDGQRVSGVALDHDAVGASLMAVMAALNRVSQYSEVPVDNDTVPAG